jgi:RNA polymerase sigma-70 factor, ECF subfamily
MRMNETPAEDAALVARVLDGDVGAFRHLVDRYHAACARYACRMLGQREDAEDALQETFVRVHRALGRYDERQTFRAWLYRILINECRSLARRRGRRERWLSRDGHPSELRSAHSGERDADIRDALQLALDGLEPLLREAFLLKHAEELEYPEMAAITGASIPALKMRVKRARDAVRPQLEELFDDR